MLQTATSRFGRRPASESFDITGLLQIATRYVAIPYMLAVAVATALAVLAYGATAIGVATVLAGAAFIVAAEAARVAMSKRGMPVNSLLILVVLAGLDVLVAINASAHGGLDGGLWLSFAVLSAVGGTLLGIATSIAAGLFGSLSFLTMAAVAGQLSSSRLPMLVLGSALVALLAPTSAVFRELIVREARRRLRQQVAQLELMNEALTAVIQSMAEGLVSYDAKGRVELWNKSLESLTGIPDFEAVGRRIDEVFKVEASGDRLEKDRHPCIKALEGPIFAGSVLEDPDRDVTLVTPTEERIPVTIAAAPIGKDPARFGAVAVVSDVRRERDIAAMREMLVSMVSHELRTPITTVLGFSELILDGGLEEDQVKEAAAEIVDAAARLENLVNDLLSSAALQRGALSLNKRPVSLEAIVKQAIASFPPGERERINIRCDDHLIEVDPDRLVQVLCNILANALKYSPRSSPVELHAYREHGMAKISVRDFGIGIDNETMGKLFTMFGRSADERVRSSPGTGLGLYIAKRLVELHGGNIEVISEPEKGSRFTVVLPL